MYVPPRTVTSEHLTEFCRVVAHGEYFGLISLCDELDSNALALSNPLSSDVTKSEVYRLASGRVDFDKCGISRSSISIVDGLTRPDFRRNLRGFAKHYTSVPFHSVYLRTAQRDQDLLLSEFYGFLHEIASKTLDIYIRPGDLLPLNTENGRESDVITTYSWWGPEGEVGSEALRKNGEAAENSLLVWGKDFSPALLPLGRFINPVKVSAIAALVAALESGLGVRAACDLAAMKPIERFELAASGRPDRIIVRRWVAALQTRHAEFPEDGYDEVARTLKQLLLPSPLGLAYASTRFRVMAGLLTGGIVFADKAEVVIQIPHAWHTLVSWF
ncbi:hypothetical protein AB0M02_10745 [Actinoplanes sp. NPDC051861]|uniref:hypothetical protein n=1 Tax=Actinoplanes sp. NPDC051861 TaxID=3155170 RepID=UPI003422AE96